MIQFCLGILLIAVAAALGWWGTQLASEGWKNWKQPVVSSEMAEGPETASPVNVQALYSQYSNEQLQKETLMLVDKMRGYLERRNLQEQTRSSYSQQQMRQAKTEGERQLVWDAQTNDLLTSPNFNFEYSQKFKTDAVLLRDELASRLPKGYKSDNMKQADYDHPTNPIGLNMVIDDLEKIAKILPK